MIGTLKLLYYRIDSININKKGLNYKGNKDIQNIKNVFKILFAYEKELYKSNNGRKESEYLFKLYMNKLFDDRELFEGTIYDIINWLNEKNKISIIIDYIHINLNNNKNYLIQYVQDDPIINEILNQQDKLGIETVNKIFTDCKIVYLKKFNLNQLHKDDNRESLFTNGKRMGRISSENIYDYCINNNLIDDIIKNIMRKSSIIRNYERYPEQIKIIKEKIFPYFNKREQIKILNIIKSNDQTQKYSKQLEKLIIN